MSVARLILVDKQGNVREWRPGSPSPFWSREGTEFMDGYRAVLSEVEVFLEDHTLGVGGASTAKDQR